MGLGNSKPVPTPYGGLPIALRRLTPSCARYLRLRYDYLRQERLRLSARGAFLKNGNQEGVGAMGLFAAMIATVNV